MKKTFSVLILALAAVSGAAIAGPEAGHPNILAASDDAQHAIDKMKAAQAANEYDLAGHAAKAEALLRQAQVEMKKAAEVSNINHGK